jgi:uridine kinase
MKLILWQWENTVLPAARQYLPPSKTHANMVLESESDLPTVEKNLYEAILQKQSLAKNPR